MLELITLGREFLVGADSYAVRCFVAGASGKRCTRGLMA